MNHGKARDDLLQTETEQKEDCLAMGFIIIIINYYFISSSFHCS